MKQVYEARMEFIAAVFVALVGYGAWLHLKPRVVAKSSRLAAVNRRFDLRHAGSDAFGEELFKGTVDGLAVSLCRRFIKVTYPHESTGDEAELYLYARVPEQDAGPILSRDRFSPNDPLDSPAEVTLLQTPVFEAMQALLAWLDYFRQAPEMLDMIWRSGPMTEDDYELMKKRMAMTKPELEEHLVEAYPGGRLLKPAFWDDERHNNPAQPVMGVCWFEALAYTNWLSTQAQSLYRLPTEAEWEAAARGHEGRAYAWGDAFDVLRCNVRETRVQQTTPVGVFPHGDSSEGICDLSGNVSEWTSSLFGPGVAGDPEFTYPYRASRVT